MIYVFNTQNQLVKTIECKEGNVFGDSNPYYHFSKYSEDFPINSFIYESNLKKWYYKRTRKYLRPAPDTLVPKELKILLLILRVPQ